MNNILVVITISLFSGNVLTTRQPLLYRGKRHHRHLEPIQAQYIVARSKSAHCFYDVCDNTEDYPEEYILNLLEKNKNLGKLFGTVIEPTQITPIHTRFHNSGVNMNVCKTMQKTQFPKSAKILGASKMSIIVNVEKYTQAVTYETCIDETPIIPTNDIKLGYRFSCKQAFNNVRLLYLTENGTLDYAQFPIPSTCVCAYSTELFK